MKMTLLQVGKERIFLGLIKNPAYSLNIRLAQISGIDQYIIQIYDNKNISFFSQNLINVSLECSRSIRKAKRYDLILKMAIAGLEGCFLFVIFTNLYLVISISEIQLDEFLSPIKSIQQFFKEEQGVLVLNSEVIQILIIHTKIKTFIWFLIEQNRCFGG